jgi:hypothetical protein
MFYYKTSLFTYNEFIKENKSNRLSKNEKIKYNTGVVKYLNIENINEVFDKELNYLDYDIESYKHKVYRDEKNITYFFNSKKNNRYRLDLVILKENNEDLKDKRLHNKKFISVSFSKFDATDYDYDNETNLYELYDVMSRIRYLIKINEHKMKNNYIFMFGKPNDNKINMYEYFIKICFPDYKLIKDYTSGFKFTNVGYYLIHKNCENLFIDTN